jgi:hypothetical protein
MVTCFTARDPALKVGLPRLSAAERASSLGAMQNCNLLGFRFQLYTL